MERERRALCRTYCTSLYTCGLWADYTQRAYNALRVQYNLYNNAFRAVLGLPRYCSASGMFAGAQTACFHATMRVRAAALVRCVRASANTVLAMIADRHDCPYITHCCNRHVRIGVG
ncbi:uncharacterized protein LOC134654883 [Cydia amplana]|uniref:uncharacterized protein LOC134654883 n=1 Tax=Cydia amplana TaxID=1869771 RepID=UPI002FE620C9